MTVAMFTNNFTPHVSGVAVAITRLVRGLRRRGHRVHIFAARYKGYTDLEPDIHRVPALPLRPPRFPLPFARRAPLMADLHHLKVDVFHAHHPFLLGQTALEIARVLHRPIVFTYHATYEELVHYVPFIPQSILRAVVLRRVFSYTQQVDALVVPSTSVADILRARGVTTALHVIPTGIDIARFRPDPTARARMRASWNVPSEHLVFVSLSRLSKEKRFDLLLEAFAQLRVQEPDRAISLIIGGDGPDRPALEKRARRLGIARDVRFLGHVDHDAVPAFLAGGDIFAYTSPNETQGLVTLEALAVGLPAVTVDAPGNRDIVEHGVSGLVTALTVEAIAAGLQELVNNQSLREKFATAAVVRAAAFSEDTTAARMEALYASLQR